MGNNAEDKVRDLSSRESFKKAKGILRTNSLLCCHVSADQKLMASCSDLKGRVEKTEVSKFSTPAPEAKCTCGENGPKLCAHAAAALLYYLGRLEEERRPAAKDEEPAKFAGLKYEGLPEILAKAIAPAGKARVEVHAESEFPHMPSKWEKMILSVKLFWEGREYSGNQGNLRQLHFGKSLAVAMQLADFTLQDRQIIRFLAINSECDGSKLALDAEQTSELFHCMGGFDGFFKDGRGIVIHTDPSEAVLLCEKKGVEYLLRPSVFTGGSSFPFKPEKIITGRSGCWVGYSGEYWWIPAAAELAWLRSFLRSEDQRADLKSGEALLSGRTCFPLRVIEKTGIADPVKKTCEPLYRALDDTDAALELTISFIYDGAVLPADGARLSTHGSDNFWRRDSETERALLDELLTFGFSKRDLGPAGFSLVLSDIEAAGSFLDAIVAKWRRERRKFSMSSRLAELSGGGRGAPAIKFHCSVLKAHAEYFELSHSFTCLGSEFSWKEVSESIRQNRNYIRLRGGSVCRIPPELSRFMSAVSDIAKLPASSDGLLHVPRYAAPYWAEMMAGLDSIPPEFAAMRNDITGIGGELDRKSHEAPARHDRFVGELRSYQSHGVKWIRLLAERGFNGVLADEMGLGKTIQAIAALAERDSGAPSLVLCPSSLIENWDREARKFSPSMKTMVVRGPARESLWEEAEKQDLVITSYTLAQKDAELIKRRRFDYLILDEAQHIKNPFTSNARTCKSIHAAHRLVLTGTPLENSPDDLWSIFDFLHPGMLGAYTTFKNHYVDIHADGDLMAQLGARVSPFILRRRKKDVCKELPPKQEQTLFCEMDSVQRGVYDKLLELCREQCGALEGKKGAGMEILTTLLRLRQACCHPGLLPDDLREKGAATPSAKMDLLQELLLENIDSGHKTLVFSQFTSLLQIIRQWLDSQSLKYEYLDGSTPSAERMGHVDNFNKNQDVRLFLLSLKAGGVGLNLTSADTVIIYDPWWNPAVENQAADRTHRIGQTMPVTSMKLVMKDSIEERILELQDRKRTLFENLVESPASSTSGLSIDDIKFLLS